MNARKECMGFVTSIRAESDHALIISGRESV